MAARPPRPRAEAGAGRGCRGDPWRSCPGPGTEWHGFLHDFMNDQACSELSGLVEQLAGEGTWAGQGDPGGEGAGRRSGPCPPLRSQPAGDPRAPPEPRCAGVGSRALSAGLHASGAWAQARSPMLAESPKTVCRAGELEGLQAEQGWGERKLQTPAWASLSFV